MYNEFVEISEHYTEFMIKVLVRKQNIFNAIFFLKKTKDFHIILTQYNWTKIHVTIESREMHYYYGFPTLL